VTIVCAYKTDRSVWIGSDSRVSAHGMIVSSDTDKWYHINGVSIGLAGSARSLSILSEWRWNAQTIPGFVRDFRTALANDNWESTDRDGNGGPADYPCDMLIVDRDKDLWLVNGDGSAIMVKTFAAIGSGAPYAYGAAYNAAAHYAPPDLINHVLRAACAYDPDCGGTLVVREIANTEGAVLT